MDTKRPNVLAQVRPFERKRLVGAFCETLLEAVDASFRIDELGLSGEERMAARAGVHMHFLYGGTRGDLVAAGATDRCFVIVRVDVCFHV